jgi:YbbR domain-containing protein
MKEKIFNNFGLKILSAIFAIVLWAVIVNIYDPTTGVTISGVAVQLTNTQSLTDKGYTYDVVDGSKISVYVSGPKSVITDIKAGDIVATADLSQITAFADYVDIDVKVVKDGQALSNVEVTPRTTAVKLNIENRISQNFDVGLDIAGTVANGYVMTNQSVNPSTVKVTGSSSLVAKISQVKATYDVSGASSDISDTASLVLYDLDGNVITDPNLELSKTEVNFTANVRPEKTISINYSISGSTADGYRVIKTEPSTSEITVSGDAKTLEKISELTIPTTVLNVDGLSSDKTFRIWLPDYMPSGISVISNNLITITVRISDAGSQDISFNTAAIQYTGLKSDMKVSAVNKETISIIVSKSTEVTGELSASDITATVNLTGQNAGQHTMAIQFKLPTGYTLVGDYTIQVDIEPGQTESSSQETTQGTSASN